MKFKFKATFEWTENIDDWRSLTDEHGNFITHTSQIVPAYHRWFRECRGIPDEAKLHLVVKKFKRKKPKPEIVYGRKRK